MVRTQIYLTDEEKSALSELGRESGKAQSVLIREAIDRYLQDNMSARRKATLERMAGAWKNRKDLPDFRKLRSEWDRKAQS